jgi:FKBP-type peptidyl-prolyl cis-trans isomerase
MDSTKRSLIVFLVPLLLAAACGDKSGDSSGSTASTDTCSHAAVTLDDGLKYEDTECGTGPEAASGDTLTVHYVGKLESGKQFDASRDHGQPFTFPLGAGQVIKGWDEGLVGMKAGGKRTLTIPPDLGYGAQGSPPVIPPNSTLIFEVELLSIDAAT